MVRMRRLNVVAAKYDVSGVKLPGLPGGIGRSVPRKLLRILMIMRIMY